MSEPVLPTELLRFSAMVLGLVRAAELKESHEGGQLWDDESRGALDVAKDLGLEGRARPTREFVAKLILKTLDISIDHYEVGVFKVTAYPVIMPNCGITYSVRVDRTDGETTVFHAAFLDSKDEAWRVVRGFVQNFTKQLADLNELIDSEQR